MDNLKNFYEIKISTLEDIENSVCLQLNDLEQYLYNYEKLYKVYDLLETEYAVESKKKILESIKTLIESEKNKIRRKLKENMDNLIEVSNEYYNFINYLANLKEKYLLFKEVIVIDDIV